MQTAASTAAPHPTPCIAPIHHRSPPPPTARPRRPLICLCGIREVRGMWTTLSLLFHQVMCHSHSHTHLPLTSHILQSTNTKFTTDHISPPFSLPTHPPLKNLPSSSNDTEITPLGGAQQDLLPLSSQYRSGALPHLPPPPPLHNPHRTLRLRPLRSGRTPDSGPDQSRPDTVCSSARKPVGDPRPGG